MGLSVRLELDFNKLTFFLTLRNPRPELSVFLVLQSVELSSLPMDFGCNKVWVEESPAEDINFIVFMLRDSVEHVGEYEEEEDAGFVDIIFN